MKSSSKTPKILSKRPVISNRLLFGRNRTKYNTLVLTTEIVTMSLPSFPHILKICSSTKMGRNHGWLIHCWVIQTWVFFGDTTIDQASIALYLGAQSIPKSFTSWRSNKGVSLPLPSGTGFKMGECYSVSGEFSKKIENFWIWIGPYDRALGQNLDILENHFIEGTYIRGSGVKGLGCTPCHKYRTMYGLQGLRV